MIINTLALGAAAAGLFIAGVLYGPELWPLVIGAALGFMAYQLYDYIQVQKGIYGT